MTKRLDWSRARAAEREAKARPPVFKPRPLRPKSAVPFPQLYARYANELRAKGEKPLPPKQWIDSLKAKSKA